MNTSLTRATVAAFLAGAMALAPTSAFATTWSHTDTAETDAGNRFIAASSAAVGAVVSHDSDSVTLFNTDTGDYIDTIDVGDGPTTASFSRNGKRLAILNDSDSTVSIINVDSLSVISTFEVAAGALSANLTPNGKSVYSGNYLDRWLNIYSTKSGKRTKKIDIGSNGNGWTTFSANGKTAYVSAREAGQIAVVNVKKHKNVDDITLGGGTPGVSALSPDGLLLAFPLYDSDLGIKVVNVQTGTITYFETVGHNPSAVAFSPDGTKLYGTDSANGTIWTIDVSSLTLVDTDVVWSAGLNGLTLKSDGSTGYLINSNVDSIWRVSIS